MKIPELSREEMIDYAKSILYPVEGKYSEKQIDERQFIFCLNCPDPVGAMDVIFEAPQGVLVETVVDEALALPHRKISSWGPEELAMDHPLRTWGVK